MKNVRCFEVEIREMVTIGDILISTGGRVIQWDADVFSDISIDSRTIKRGELFIAIKGERFDGHNFLQDALKKGSGALVSTLPLGPIPSGTIICVHDTLRALQDVARFIRLKKDIPVVAVTGSNGKTTTKELIASILGTTYKILKNTGNLNNHIGLPLSLTRMSNEDEIAVLEMGASGPDEIKDLCGIAVPTHGVLTNISQAHLEGFKDIETIRKTKLELLESVGAVAVNADDMFLMEGVQRSGFKGRLIRYGLQNDAEVKATDIRLFESGSIFNLHIGEHESIEVHSKIPGRFNIYNILAAASIGSLFQIDLLQMKSAIDLFSGVPMRLEVRELDGIKVINDAYNANPASMEEAINELIRIRKGRKIVVLGDMLELGSYAEEAHRKLGRLISRLSVDIFIAVGPLMAIAASEFSGKVYVVPDAREAGILLKEIRREGDTVLIKGSRAMAMDKVLET